jgi:hypothetical protein
MNQSLSTPSPRFDLSVLILLSPTKDTGWEFVGYQAEYCVKNRDNEAWHPLGEKPELNLDRVRALAQQKSNTCPVDARVVRVEQKLRDGKLVIDRIPQPGIYWQGTLKLEREPGARIRQDA